MRRSKRRVPMSCGFYPKYSVEMKDRCVMAFAQNTYLKQMIAAVCGFRSKNSVVARDCDALWWFLLKVQGKRQLIDSWRKITWNYYRSRNKTNSNWSRGYSTRTSQNVGRNLIARAPLVRWSLMVLKDMMVSKIYFFFECRICDSSATVAIVSHG